MEYTKQEMLNILFEPNEKTYVGNAYGTNVVSPFKSSGEFFSINPLHGTVDTDWQADPSKRSYMKPRRADLNVTKFRNFLFEIDSMPINDQIELLKASEIPFASVVYSGGKSVHAILSLEKPLSGEHTEAGVMEYNRVWKRLAEKINNIIGKKVIDSSCQNPSRLSRFPYYTANGRNTQNILSLGSRISSEEFESLLKTCPEIQETTTIKRFVEVEDAKEFLKKANPLLVNMIKYPMWAKDSAGLYPEAFKLCLWAIDETGIPKEELTSLFEEHVFPHYQKIGYPQRKWMNAIDSAYKKKGY